jgi:hypothetical protein
MVDHSVSLHSISYQLVFPLGTMFGPGSTHGCRIEPDDGSSEHPPASVREYLLQENEVVHVAENVKVGKRLSEAERFRSKASEKIDPGLEGIFIAMRPWSPAAAVPVLVSIYAVGWISEDHIERLRWQRRHDVETTALVDVVNLVRESLSYLGGILDVLLSGFLTLEHLEGIID